MRSTLLFLLPLAVACGTSAQQTHSGAGNSQTHSDAGSSPTRGIAVVNSDYRSTSISLVDPASGVLARDSCLNSGAVIPVLSLALSGDVTLASSAQPSAELLLLDRTNSALLWTDPKTCNPLRQLAVGTGFYSNPHDVVGVSATKAYVTRYELNRAPSAGPNAFDQGDDLLIIDPSVPKITGRIDLAPQAVQSSGVALQARPDHVLSIHGKVYVSLGNLSADFKTMGTGRIVIVDPAKDSVSGTIDIPDRKSCGGLGLLPSSETLLVACGGDYNDPANQARQSGILMYDVSGDTPRLTRTIDATAVENRAIASSVFAAVSDNLIVIATPGDVSGMPPDTLWMFNVSTGNSTKLLDGSGSYVYGGIITDPQGSRVYVTDSAMKTPRVHVFDVKDPRAVKEISSFEANPANGLPPRQIGWY